MNKLKAIVKVFLKAFNFVYIMRIGWDLGIFNQLMKKPLKVILGISINILKALILFEKC